jgi:nucleotide-binding universal stress UspA family protein
MPPLASERLRHRLRAIARDVNEFMEMVEREGHREAQRLAAMGVALARAAGCDAEPLVKRTWGPEGLRLAHVAEQVKADLVLVCSRGLGGTHAVLGSVSDMVVHYTALPVVVIPHPLLTAEYAMLAHGPVVVGWDGSSGAQEALAAAGRLFPGRDVLRVCVDEGDDAPGRQPVSQSGMTGKSLCCTLNAGVVFAPHRIRRAHRVRQRARCGGAGRRVTRPFWRDGSFARQHRSGNVAPRSPAGDGCARPLAALDRCRVRPGRRSCPGMTYGPDQSGLHPTSWSQGSVGQL